MFVVLLCTLYRQLELGGMVLRSEQAAGRAHTETHIKVRLGSSVHQDHIVKPRGVEDHETDSFLYKL